MRWMSSVMCAGLVVTQIGLVSAEDRKYTLQDLQALAERKAWVELRGHLADLPPAQRGPEWSRLVEQACLVSEPLNDWEAGDCYLNLKTLLQANPGNADFAWTAGKWARRRQASWAAVPFFDAAIRQSGDPRCADADVVLAVVSGLDGDPAAEPERVAQSRRLAFDRCWPAVKAEVVKAFGASGNYYKANTCPSLLEKKALAGLQAKRCRPQD